jgi:hypothetical protein
MQRASKPAMTVYALLVSWLIGGGFVRADPNASGNGASSGRTAGVVVVTGGAAERHRELVGQVIEKAVRAAGWLPPSKPLTKSQSDRMLTCFDADQPPSCISASLPIARVFVVTVENGQAANGAPMVILTGKAALIDPPVTAIRQQHCDRCASNDLTAASDELAKIVLQDLALGAGTTLVDFRSEPDGAEIVLDGRRVGATNAKLNTYPGKHLVRFEKPGYIAQTREFTAEEDKSVVVAVELKKSDSDKPPIPPRSKLLPGILLGASGVLLFTGAAGISYAVKDASDDKYRYPRALPIGISSAVAGVAAAGVGLYLLRKGPRTSAPTVSATVGGAVLGWMGTFR